MTAIQKTFYHVTEQFDWEEVNLLDDNQGSLWHTLKEAQTAGNLIINDTADELCIPQPDIEWPRFNENDTSELKFANMKLRVSIVQMDTEITF
jgi:hypothetical protein